MTTLTVARGKSRLDPIVEATGGMATLSTDASTLPPGILPVVAIDRTSDKPLYKQLYEGYRDAIVERRLSAGQRLPSTRSLAAELRISRIPVLEPSSSSWPRATSRAGRERGHSWRARCPT